MWAGLRSQATPALRSEPDEARTLDRPCAAAAGQGARASALSCAAQPQRRAGRRLTPGPLTSRAAAGRRLTGFELTHGLAEQQQACGPVRMQAVWAAHGRHRAPQTQHGWQCPAQQGLWSGPSRLHIHAWHCVQSRLSAGPDDRRCHRSEQLCRWCSWQMVAAAEQAADCCPLKLAEAWSGGSMPHASDQTAAPVPRHQDNPPVLTPARSRPGPPRHQHRSGRGRPPPALRPGRSPPGWTPRRRPRRRGRSPQRWALQALQAPAGLPTLRRLACLRAQHGIRSGHSQGMRPAQGRCSEHGAAISSWITSQAGRTVQVVPPANQLQQGLCLRVPGHLGRHAPRVGLRHKGFQASVHVPWAMRRASNRSAPALPAPNGPVSCPAAAAADRDVPGSRHACGLCAQSWQARLPHAAAAGRTPAPGAPPQAAAAGMPGLRIAGQLRAMDERACARAAHGITSSGARCAWHLAAMPQCRPAALGHGQALLPHPAPRARICSSALAHLSRRRAAA